MPEEDYVDEDPEYEEDDDDNSVLVGLAAADPRSVPPDEGDAGTEGN